MLGALGAGGMGLVYSGYDPHLDVARSRSSLLRGGAAVRDHADEARTRLLREAQAMAKINHPNVVRVHEVGTFHDQVYLAMEFADAGTLRDWLAAEALLAARVVIDALVAAGRGLAAAHAAGLVHRDFKPDNVLMSNDGLGCASPTSRLDQHALIKPAQEATPVQPSAAARRHRASSASGSTPLAQNLTRATRRRHGKHAGLHGGFARSTFAGETTTARTDQFAFCVALYEALYGERPVAGSGYVELSTRVLIGDDVAAAQAQRRVPAVVTAARCSCAASRSRRPRAIRR